jgi:hypothetical protein
LLPFELRVAIGLISAAGGVALALAYGVVLREEVYLTSEFRALCEQLRLDPVGQI